MKFEYTVCLVQEGRATWENGQWLGTVKYDGTNEKESLQSCPKSFDYLNQRGAEGWDLVSVTTEITKGELTGLFTGEVQVQRFAVYYMKRCAS